MNSIRNKEQCSHHKHTAFTGHLLLPRSQYITKSPKVQFISQCSRIQSSFFFQHEVYTVNDWCFSLNHTHPQNPASVNTQYDLLWEIEVWSAEGNLHFNRKLCWMSVREFSGTRCSRVCGENEFNPKPGSVGTAGITWFTQVYPTLLYCTQPPIRSQWSSSFKSPTATKHLSFSLILF